MRPAVPADAEAMAAVLAASIRELCAADHHGDADRIAAWTHNKTPGSVRGWIADPALVVLVAERGGVLAGVAAGTRNGEVLL